MKITLENIKNEKISNYLILIFIFGDSVQRSSVLEEDLLDL